MKAQDNRKAFARKELWKIAIAIFALILGSLIYYSYIRNEALRMTQRRAEITLKSTERIILIHLGRIETAVNAIQPMVQYALDDPDAMYGIARHTVESSKHIMGAGIAFTANYFPQKGYWYQTYVGYQKGSDTLISKQLGSRQHDYFQMSWFKKGMRSSTGFWSDPYYDNAGGKDYMVSYCLPVSDSTGKTVAVICTDVTLDTLSSIVKSTELYPNSFCTLTTTDGEVLVGPPSTCQDNRKTHVFSKKFDGNDMILSLTIPDADLYKRLRKSTLFYALMALTGILSVLFISYRAVQNLWALYDIHIKEQQIEDELNIARNIQASLLPNESAYKSNNNLDISGIQMPAKYVGGDIYDYYIRDNKLFFCIGDVSGKGVPAALLMTIAHTLFRTLSAHNDRPELIMTALNDSISNNNPDIMFLTLIIGVLDLPTGELIYCNAGHNSPIIIRSNSTEMIDTPHCLLLGIDPGVEYTTQRLLMEPGDTLFLYTDGLTEAENLQKQLLGEEKVLELASTFNGTTAEEQIREMHELVLRFADKAEQSDDLTMLAIRYFGTKHTLTLNNDIQELNKLNPFLNKFFDEEKLDKKLLSQLDLALEEALINVIMYAYPKGEKGSMELTLEAKDGQIHSVLSDSGVSFDPLQRPPVNLDVPLEERKIGGLGIHLIKEIMNEVTYEYKDGKNVLTMTYDV